MEIPPRRRYALVAIAKRSEPRPTGTSSVRAPGRGYAKRADARPRWPPTAQPRLGPTLSRLWRHHGPHRNLRTRTSPPQTTITRSARSPSRMTRKSNRYPRSSRNVTAKPAHASPSATRPLCSEKAPCLPPNGHQAGPNRPPNPLQGETNRPSIQPIRPRPAANPHSPVKPNHRA